MASFVAEVLSSAGQLEREEINEKLCLLGRRMEELKLDIHTATKATFTDFDPTYDATTILSDKVKSISTEMQELSQKIETEIKGQLNVSTGEFQSLARQLEQVSLVITVLDKLSRACQLMDDFATATADKKFSHAAALLSELEQALQKPVCEREEEVSILQALHIEHSILKQKLIQELNDVWKEMVVWSQPEYAGRSSEKSVRKEEEAAGGHGDAGEEAPCTWELTLPKPDEFEQKALAEVVNALEALGLLEGKMKVFGHQVLTNIICGLILGWREVVITEKSLSHGRQLVLKAAGKDSRPNCVDVFAGIGNVLDMLQESLLHHVVPAGSSAHHGQTSGDSGVMLLTIVGQEIGEKVAEAVVKECLTNAIPSSAKELERFHEVAAITEQFQERLVSIGFLPASCHVLLDFVQNINVLFANKKCQNILQEARALMTKDIHDTVQVSADAPAGALPPLDKAGGPSREKTRKMDLAGDTLLSSATFRMPTCRISVCVQEIMDLVYVTLNEATTSSPQCAAQMFYAARNIFHLFSSVFPTYHAHSLANFPQLSALHHNNCMYLAHHLLTLGHQFAASLPKDISATFVDLIPEIRELGTSCLLDQLNTQRAVIQQCLQGAEGFAAVDEEKNYSAAERAVKQAVHQLTHLQKVWCHVLPHSVFCKAIGILLNTLIVDVMDGIIALEDISSDAARKLSLLMKLIDDKGGLLFLHGKDGGDTEGQERTNKVKVELLRHVPRWAKFTELQLVLNGTLQGISDRWAEGKGPLAAEFTPNELKQLIRALFQNTDRRAAVLAKIK